MRLRYRLKIILMALVATGMLGIGSSAVRASATPDITALPPGTFLRPEVIVNPLPAASTSLPPRHIRLTGTANLLGLLEQGSAFPDPRDINLATARPRPLQRGEDPSIIAESSNDHAAVPLPSPAWSGLSVLALLGLIGCRKQIIRFLT